MGDAAHDGRRTAWAIGRRGGFVRDRSGRSGGPRKQKRRQTDDEKSRRAREQGRGRERADGDARPEAVGWTDTLGATAGACWEMLDAGPPGGKGEPLGRMEVSGAAPDWALVRELASISLLPHGVDDADWARRARAWGRFVVDMDWPVDAIASGWG
ncbi:hypothetical protein CFAM422_000014 [Trichoderma lentiforme]|uniref:Uncharacterized protein n=1 Tax=Trichoderma lentiforme TaxID=1567552 RepID=A0A9P5CG79_9HYPO|nr:hypothetical protein CFAM422_000014 [Trichoderma lentiforme]